MAEMQKWRKSYNPEFNENAHLKFKSDFISLENLSGSFLLFLWGLFSALIIYTMEMIYSKLIKYIFLSGDRSVQYKSRKKL